MAAHRTQAQTAKAQFDNRIHKLLQKSEKFAGFKNLCDSILYLNRLSNKYLMESVRWEGEAIILQHGYISQQEKWVVWERDVAVMVLIVAVFLAVGHPMGY
ncbi:hypothetical protein TWF281_009767 [Arthrobotrys megalospora]